MHIINVRMLMNVWEFLSEDEMPFHLSPTAASFLPGKINGVLRDVEMLPSETSALHFQPCSLKKTAS